MQNSTNPKNNGAADLTISTQQWRILRDLNLKPERPRSGTRSLPRGASPNRPVIDTIPVTITRLIVNYQTLIKTEKWLEAVTFYRVHLHQPLTEKLTDFRLIVQLLQPFFNKNIEMVANLQEDAFSCFLLFTMAQAQAHLGRLEIAQKLLHLHNSLRRQANDQEHLARGLVALATLVCIPQREFLTAASNLDSALKIAQATGKNMFLAEVQINQAWLHILQGQTSSEVTAAIARSENIARSEFDRHNLSRIYGIWVHYWLEKGIFFKALTWSARARQEAQIARTTLEMMHGLWLFAKTTSATLIHRDLFSSKEQNDYVQQVENALSQSLQMAIRNGIVQYQIECCLAILRLRCWQFTLNPRSFQHLKVEFLPFANMIREFIKTTGWYLKLAELYQLLAELYKLDGKTYLAHKHQILADKLS